MKLATISACSDLSWIVNNAVNTGSVYYYKSPHFDEGQRWISGAAAVFVSFLLINCRPLELLNFIIAFDSLVLTESPREVSEPRTARMQDCHEEACQDDMHTDSALFLDNILHKDFYKHQFGVKKSAHQARYYGSTTAN